MLREMMSNSKTKRGLLIKSVALLLGLTFGVVVPSAMGNVNSVHAAQHKVANPKVITFGDSITWGWDGHKRVSTPYPEIIANSLNVNVKNAGSPGAQLTANNRSNKGNTLQTEVTKNYYGMKNYQVATVFMGINDYHHSTASLKRVQYSMNYQLKRIKRANSKVKIYGVLPMTSYRKTRIANHYIYRDESNLPGKAGYTLNQLRTMERKLYAKYHIVVLTKFPSQPTPKYLGDLRLHPNQRYYDYMGNHLTKFIEYNWTKGRN